MSLWDFARLAGSDDLREADLASVLGEALCAFEGGADLALTPGVGLYGRHGQLRVLAFGDARRCEQPPGLIMPLKDCPSVARRVIQSLGGLPDGSDLVDVMAVTPPRRQLSPGSAISGAALGVAGAQVSWNLGAGFMTAGHVAPSLHMTLHDGATPIGTVVWSNDPAGHGALIEPDVAIVALDPGVLISNPIASAAAAGPADTVTVLSTGATATVMGLAQFLFMASQNATCGDSYFTTNEVTAPGDSGGPVMLGASVIGHVIGGSPGVTSFVQDIAYQLREAANPLRGGLLGLRI